MLLTLVGYLMLNGMFHIVFSFCFSLFVDDKKRFCFNCILECVPFILDVETRTTGYPVLAVQ